MPVGKDGQQGRATPPAPESPLWLPALSQATAGAGRLAEAAASGVLPRAKDLKAATASSPNRDPRHLFDARSLTQQQLPLPPGRPASSSWDARARSPTAAATAKLPAIHAQVHAAAPAAGRDRTGRALATHQHDQASKLLGPDGDGPAEAPLPVLPEVPGSHHEPPKEPEAAAAGPSASAMAASGSPLNARARSPIAASCRTGGAAAAVQQFDPDRVPGVETGADAVAFFGRYGQDSPVKFFYCSRWVRSCMNIPVEFLICCCACGARRNTEVLPCMLGSHVCGSMLLPKLASLAAWQPVLSSAVRGPTHAKPSMHMPCGLPLRPCSTHAAPMQRPCKHMHVHTMHVHTIHAATYNPGHAFQTLGSFIAEGLLRGPASAPMIWWWCLVRRSGMSTLQSAPRGL